ncbi:MAG: hypothetical protein V4597_19135 [Pseudomonadota bacterium]|uniref:hypothetical protein n=1 Tax=Phenylobacterium sp. TaxID=1871053 RepID=UPI00271BF3CA|nr:hypothetical protein [Phenylobacterium sp.]MDO8380474.1 hypothetical protein [Phenylobacterium sp.]
MSLLRPILAWGPVFFGIAFLAPLFAQILQALGVTAPLGLPPIAVGLAVGGTWGLIAKLGGRWI